MDPLGLYDMVSSYRAFHAGVQPIRDWRVAHYNRNQHNQTISYKDLKREGWDGSVPAYFHQQGPGNEGNQKFVSPDGHSEAIFDQFNQPVTDPVNGPTYNFQDPRSNPIGHFFDDMLPYFMWGNTPCE